VFCYPLAHKEAAEQNKVEKGHKAFYASLFCSVPQLTECLEEANILSITSSHGESTNSNWQMCERHTKKNIFLKDTIIFFTLCSF